MDAPSAAELQANPVVQAALAAAWADSLADDDTLRHEEGGYIYANAVTGEIVVRRVRQGGVMYWTCLLRRRYPTVSPLRLITRTRIQAGLAGILRQVRTITEKLTVRLYRGL